MHSDFPTNPEVVRKIEALLKRYANQSIEFDTNKTVVAMCGAAGSGKTFAVTHFGENATVLNFADPLKELCLKLFPVLEHKNLWGTQEEKEVIVPELGFSGRYCMQFVGTDIFRAKDPLIWLRIMAERIRSAPHNTVLIGDLRFLNEINFVKSYTDSCVVKITTDRTTTDQHISEQSLPDRLFDHVVRNNYDSKFLEDMKDALLENEARHHIITF